MEINYNMDHLGSIVDQRLNIEKLMSRNKPIKTGFSKLDDYLEGGITPGMIVLGAGPGQGKSTLAIQMGEYISREENVPVLYFSLEMSAERVAAKTIAMNNFRSAKEAGHPVDQYESGLEAKEQFFTASELFNPAKLAQLPEEKKQQLQYAQKLVSENKKFFIIDKPFCAREIVEMVEKFLQDQKAQAEISGEALKKPLVIVDYLQILPADPKAKGSFTDKQQVDVNLKVLRELVLMDIPVLLISSLKRGNYSGKVASMRMDSFKETGGIEYSADFLFGLQFAACHGADGCNPDQEKAKYPRNMELMILKQRYGPVDVAVPLRYYAEFDYLEEGFWEAQKSDEEAEVKETVEPEQLLAAEEVTQVDAPERTHKESEVPSPVWRKDEIAYINNTKVAYEIRKGNWKSGKTMRCNVSKKDSKTSYITEFTLTGEITNFDCDVADAIYSIYRSGSPAFLTRHVLYALSGNSKQTLTPQKEKQILDSLQRLMDAEITISCGPEMKKMRKKAGYQTLISGKFLKVNKVKNAREYTYWFPERKDDFPLPLHLYGEQTNQMLAFPKQLLEVSKSSGRRLYDTEENVMIKRYLLRRLEVIRKNESNLYHIRKVTYYNSLMGKESGMLPALGIRREDFETHQWQYKLDKTHETVTGILDNLVSKGYLNGYESNSREGVILSNKVNDPFKLKLK